MQRTGAPASHALSNANGHCHCLMCGGKNPLSLGLHFEPMGEGAVHGWFEGNERLQGYDGLLHGGVISALLDAAMTHCLFHAGIRAVTAELRVRFSQPVPCSSRLELRASLVCSHGPIYRLESKLCMGGKTLCRAEAKFMRKKEEH